MFWLHDIHAFLSVSPVVVWEWGLIRITESTQSQPHWLVKSPLQAHVLRSFFGEPGTLPFFSASIIPSHFVHTFVKFAALQNCCLVDTVNFRPNRKNSTRGAKWFDEKLKRVAWLRLKLERGSDWTFTHSGSTRRHRRSSSAKTTSSFPS